MFSAAIDQTVQAMTVDHTGLRTSCDTNRMTTHALNRLATISSR